MIIEHRDGKWKLGARICDSLSAFIYQGAIFHAQISCYKENNWHPMTPPDSAEGIWIWIEMYCFYIYIFAIARFIVQHTLFSGICFKKTKDKSDMNKVIHDFLTYEYTNLIWSSLNTVLCIMPLICLFVINRKLPDDLDLDNSKMSYAILLVVVCLANVFQFAFKPRLFYPVFKKKLFIKSESSDLLLHQDDDQLNQSVIESSLIKGEDDKDHHYVWMKQ